MYYTRNDHVFNNLQVTHMQKVPRWSELPDNTPGNVGNIIFNRQDRQFYGHDGNTWVLLSGQNTTTIIKTNTYIANNNAIPLPPNTLTTNPTPFVYLPSESNAPEFLTIEADGSLTIQTEGLYSIQAGVSFSDAISGGGTDRTGRRLVRLSISGTNVPPYLVSSNERTYFPGSNASLAVTIQGSYYLQTGSKLFLSYEQTSASTLAGLAGVMIVAAKMPL